MHAGEPEPAALGSRGRDHELATLLAELSSRLVPLRQHEPGHEIEEALRRLCDEALRRNEARLESAAALAGLGFYEVDFERGTVFVDERFADICGVPSRELPGLEVLESWLGQLHPEHRSEVLELRRQLHAGEREDVSVEYRFLHPTKGERWLHHLGRVERRDEHGLARRTCGVLRDITDRKRVEAEVRELGRRLICAQEEERAQLARDLHDDLTQRLAALAIQIGRAEQDARGPLAQTLRSAGAELARLSEDVHSLAWQLHPAALTDLGLAAALRGECEGFERRLGIPLALELGALPPRVPKSAALCLYRVAQEALSNVARHAGARSVTVRLAEAGGGLCLSVRDDGAGFDPGRPPRRERLGLSSMRDRVRLLGGRLELDTAVGCGTTVEAWVPIGEEVS